MSIKISDTAKEIIIYTMVFIIFVLFYIAYMKSVFFRGRLVKVNVVAGPTVSNFESFNNAPENTKTVLFHRPGCIHCENLMPTWNKLLSTHGHLMKTVDVKQNPEVVEKENLKGFPTIKKGAEVYSGDRSYEDLIKFINKK